MKPFRLSRLAKRDLEQIADYIGERNPSAAVRQLEKLLRTLETLASEPLMGELRRDLPGMPRAFSSGNYVILYKPAQRGIHVIRVAHAARDLPSLLRQRDDRA
jgi:toxin ParE1/3/4